MMFKYPYKTFLSALLLATTLLTSHLSLAKATFQEYVAELKSEAMSLGYSADFVAQTFSNLTYREKVVKADKSQPETTITLDTYLSTRVPDWKVKKALALLEKHREILDKVEKEFGVQKRFIVALWGNESNFGSIMGKHSVINALVTLAYEGRREAMFKKQLFAALKILDQGHIELDNFVGSWAGAMGQSQFMPTSFLDYAVDFDQDGKKDIWNNTADVFASIANFLKSEGWSEQITWGRQVKLPENFDLRLAGLKRSLKKPLADWAALGVTKFNGQALPEVAIQASLIAPDGAKGRIYLVYQNFHTLMKWNRSSYFGISVSYLSDRIKKGA